MQLITFVFIVTYINMDVKLKLGWKRGGMEEGKDGRGEEWKKGRVEEEWKKGRREEGKDGRMEEGWKKGGRRMEEEWKKGRVEGVCKVIGMYVV